jgi:transposase
MATYIGVDVGKKSLQVYSPITNESFEVTNNELGFNKLLTYLNKYHESLQDIIIVFEPTGGYE